MDGINKYRKRWVNREKVALSVLNEWTCHVKEAVSTITTVAPTKNKEKAIS